MTACGGGAQLLLALVLWDYGEFVRGTVVWHQVSSCPIVLKDKVI